MHSCRHYAGILTLLVCLLPSMLSAQPLPDSIAIVLKKQGIPLSAVSLDIREVGSQDTLVSLNSNVARNPASVIKLVTTLSALEILGPNHQWNTHYWADGTISDGVLKGDLVLQGGGDPFITVDKFLHQILSIRQRGIHTITGSLVIDNSLFDVVQHDRAQFDGQPSRLYNVEPEAALVNFSATQFVIQPMQTKGGERIVVFADPPLADLVVENNLKPQAGKCVSPKRGWSHKLRKKGDRVIASFDGKYHSRCGQHAIARSLFSNREYIYRLFKYLWGNSGGTFDGGYRMAATPDHAIAITSYPSAPLADIITSINKYSNNVMARQLILSLDAQEQDRSATLAGGRALIKDWLAANLGGMPGLIIDNGAGLSRKTRITAANLTDLLQHGWRSNYRAEFLSSFSLAALDGTMRKRLIGSELSGRARIKTGLINNVRSMAGFVNARNNKYYSVAMMIESKKINFGNGNVIQDAVLKWIYNR